MDSVRTSSLFHYTNYQSLCKIIKDGLIPNYCREDLTYMDKDKEMIGETLGIPMVSFCDIPLSRIKEFSARYGRCAIGLDKKWAERRAINPILYASDSGILCAYHIMNDMVNYIKYINPKLEKAERIANKIFGDISYAYSIIPLLGHVKKYQSPRKKTSELQNNYLENEWRYVVPESKEIQWFWSNDDYKKWRGTSKRKPSPSTELVDKKLFFDVDDISFIIVNKESQVNKMIKYINNIDYVGGNKLEEKDKADSRIKLLSRIISLERIMSDF